MAMRRESSTVVALVGTLSNELTTAFGRSPNVAVIPPSAGKAQPPEDVRAGPDRPGWEAGALAMREAARRRATYVLVPDDPLAPVAAAWQAMWDLSSGPAGAAEFERRASEALAGWRDKRFELPDYYLVVAPAQGVEAGPDLYLGPLRAVRSRRVAVAASAAGPVRPGQVLDALRSLGHGPWWPPLDELLDAARRFYAGGLEQTQAAPGGTDRT
jgi:hypothetical protein